MKVNYSNLTLKYDFSIQAGWGECSSLVKAKLEERHAAFLYLPMDLFIMTVPNQFD